MSDFRNENLLEITGSFGEGGDEYTLLDYSVFRRVIGSQKLQDIIFCEDESVYEYQKDKLIRMWNGTYMRLKSLNFPFEQICVTTDISSYDRTPWTKHTYVLK